MKATKMLKLALPEPATSSPSDAVLKRHAERLADTFVAMEEVDDSAAAYARYAFSLLRFADGLTKLADFLYYLDCALFAKVGKKIDAPKQNAFWKTFKNQLRILATKKDDRVTDNGKVLRITCPGGEYRVVYRNMTAEEKRQAADKLESSAESSRGGGQTAGDNQFTIERIAEYLERAIRTGMSPDDVMAAAAMAAYKTKRARKAALTKMAKNA